MTKKRERNRQFIQVKREINGATEDWRYFNSRKILHKFLTKDHISYYAPAGIRESSFSEIRSYVQFCFNVRKNTFTRIKCQGADNRSFYIQIRIILVDNGK